ncbi:MAG: hypothetical protein ACXABY_09990 [Candidatus Thorarchaeota archaeon]|jgi:hypothetical protein
MTTGYSGARYIAQREWVAEDGGTIDLTTAAVEYTKRLVQPIRIIDVKTFVTTALAVDAGTPVVKVQQADADGTSNKVVKAVIDDYADLDAVGTIHDGENAGATAYLKDNPAIGPSIAAGKCMIIEVTTAGTDGTLAAGECMFVVFYQEEPV